jgi:SHS2 domain-containing protein
MTVTSRLKAEGSWRFLDHTADIRMEVLGRTREALFANAALGLTSLLAAPSSAAPETEFGIVLDGVDYEELLVDWLSEILFLNQTQGVVPVEVHIDHLAERRIEARIEGRFARPEEQGQDLEIKGVTYHGLSIVKTDEGYSARIVFDI